MYINDINLLAFIITGIMGLLVGQLVNLSIIKLPEHQKIFTNKILSELKLLKPNYIIIILNSILYMAILYAFGIDNIVKLIAFFILIPLLICAFYIDSKKQIIPNRLTLTILEVGLVFAFIQGIININVAFEMLLGGIVGAGTFLIITLLGGLIFGKETMGFGDVKLMGALGLFFGWRYIIAISVLSFFIGAIYSLVLIIILKIKKQEQKEYIAFGPFIVLASLVVTFIQIDVLIVLAFKIFTLGKFNG